MTKLPVCSGEETIRAFERAGWTRVRQRGSHVSLVRAESPVVLTPVGLLRDPDQDSRSPTKKAIKAKN